MNLQDYLKQRQQQSQAEPRYRKLCTTCVQPEFSCYCKHIQKFDPQIEFVILIHPIEVRRRIATGRMSHLMLENSHLIAGQNYSDQEQINSLIANAENQCLILYPGRGSQNLTDMNFSERCMVFDPSKKLVLFIIDGTWATAKKMLRQSQNLSKLPRICFTPSKPSNFRVRKQPAPGCFSTIEAIHQSIELIAPCRGISLETREHDKLLYVFDRMVDRQLEFVERSRLHPELCRYHRARQSWRSK